MWDSRECPKTLSIKKPSLKTVSFFSRRILTSLFSLYATFTLSFGTSWRERGGVSCNVTGLGPWRCGRQTADVRRLTRPSLLHPRPPITHPTLSLLVTPVPVLPALARIAPTLFDPECAIFLWGSRVEGNHRFDHEEEPQSRRVRSPYFLGSNWNTQRLTFNHSTSSRKLNKPRPAGVYPQTNKIQIAF